MAIRIAINGFGRIGRRVLQALYASNRHEEIQLVAINDVASIESSVQQLNAIKQGDEFSVGCNDQALLIAGDEVQYFSQANPVKLPWKALAIDIVLECTGRFTQAEQAHMHLLAGAKKVLISALSDEKIDATIVYGVNESTLKPEHKIVSNGSCTLNCLAHVVNVLDTKVGIASALSTTLHTYDDVPKSEQDDAALTPIKTRSPESVGLIFPHLKGKVDGVSIRIPTFNVAMSDITISSKETVTVEDVNAWIRSAAANDTSNALICVDEKTTSAAFKHNAASCIIDTTQTKVQQGQLIKVAAWFDNEWAFSNRMLDTLESMSGAK